VNQPVPPGRPAPLDSLSSTMVPEVCQWDASEGGPFADVLFAGLAPGQTGVYQVNVRVAPNLATGQIVCRSALSPADSLHEASMVVPVSGRTM
jgi:uncharacterized protein (TIGR03437 family)